MDFRWTEVQLPLLKQGAPTKMQGGGQARQNAKRRAGPPKASNDKRPAKEFQSPQGLKPNNIARLYSAVETAAYKACQFARTKTIPVQ
jgi:hypothetical protein